MGKAYETGLVCITLSNSSTSTVAAYKFVRMSTTTDTAFDLITTRGTHWAVGITQEAINPSAVGKIAVSGVSRVKISGTAWTTVYRTTSMGVLSTANGSAARVTTSTVFSRAVGLHACAASDIATVLLTSPFRMKM